MKSIFAYMDFREYLHVFYGEKKAASRFSYREFSRMAGFASPVFLKLVIERKSNLSSVAAKKVARAMGLVNSEAVYFECLVKFNQERNTDKKLRYLDDLLRLSRNIRVESVGADQYEYFNKWYYAVVRELAPQITGDNLADEIARRIIPSIERSHVEESLALLIRLGLLSQDEHGHYVRGASLLTSGTNLPVEVVRNYQRQMAILVSDALAVTPPENREVSGATISISAKAFDQVREEINRCRRRILEIAQADTNPDQVYRINFQAFPLSKSAHEKLQDDNSKSVQEVPNV